MSVYAMGLQLMGYGLLGTFAVLFACIGIIKLLVLLFPDRKETEPRD